jgi:hypothetical protein
MRAFWVTTGAAWVAWAVVNIPIALLAPEGWSRFYTFSSVRGADWGSPWYVLQVIGHPIPPERMNLVATGLLGLLCLGVAFLIVQSPRRPRYAQVAFSSSRRSASPPFTRLSTSVARAARCDGAAALARLSSGSPAGPASWPSGLLQQYGNDNKGLPYWYAFAPVLTRLRRDDRARHPPPARPDPHRRRPRPP